MAITGALTHLSVIALLGCLSVACGTRLLTWLRLSVDSDLERALYASGLFFAALEIILFVLVSFGEFRQGTVLVVLAVAAFSARGEWRQVPKLARTFSTRLLEMRRRPATFSVVILALICLAVDGLMAMAPLTGSDALHYHFLVPKLEIMYGYKPMFSITHSFLVGNGHLLVSLGMLLGSDELSLGLIYLGGVLTAASLFVLTRKLTSEVWACIAVVVFLLSPMVYWQISTSGCPDIWMAFYTTLAVLAAVKAVQTSRRQWWFAAGAFAGVVGGAKYTGWAVPVVLVLGCFLLSGSWKWAALCGLCSLPTGILPLLRNTAWTGDPFFPFLSQWLTPGKVNSYGLSAIIADTHSGGFSRNALKMIAYPFVLSLSGNKYGVGQYFGPLVLAFCPLLILSFRKNSLLASVTAAVWATVLISNAMTSQMARFLLPIFPLAIALVFGGVSEGVVKGRLIRVGCKGTLLIFLLFGLGSEALYARDFLPVVIGTEKRESFLKRMAPDYQTIAFINRSLHGPDIAMVFFRHLYYLDGPFISGSPDNSWMMNPATVTEPTKLLALLHHEHVRWVVKAPDYPEPLAASFQMLEDEGRLRPVFCADVLTFTGFRIYGNKTSERVVILEVSSAL